MGSIVRANNSAQAVLAAALAASANWVQVAVAATTVMAVVVTGSGVAEESGKITLKQ